MHRPSERALRALPSRTELAARVQRFTQAAQRYDNLAAVLLVAALLGNLVVSPWLQRRQAGWLLLPLLAVEIVGVSLFWRSATRGMVKAHGVQCPSCLRPFTKETAPVAVATGNCGACGAPVARPEG